MSKSEVVYQLSTNLQVMATNLRTRYYLHLGHVDLDTIFFAEKIGDRPKKSGIGEISGIKSAWLKKLLEDNANHQRYCIAVWSDDWSLLDPSVQEWLMFDMLYSVDPVAEGGLRKKDVAEHGVLASYLGVYWRKETTLPSLLGSADPLDIPPPPLAQDEGSTMGEE